MGFYGKQLKLGVLGGGQLGRMMIQEAIDLDIFVAVLDPSTDAPCAEIAHEFVLGSFADEDTVYAFGKGMDVLTVEIEHVSVAALERLKAEGVKVYPDPEVLKIIQDKGLQKQFYRVNQLPTSSYVLVETREELVAQASKGPCVQKLRKGGYDGKGVKVLRDQSDIQQALEGPSVLEDLVDIQKEISVIVARNPSGEIKTFPAVEMVFDPVANLVDLLQSPAIITPEQETQAATLATRIAEAFKHVGLLAVEMFVDQKGEILINEVAPRPHNSGHQTIEGNYTSQYAQHLRAILDLPLGNTSIIKPSVMVNLLGAESHSGPVYYKGIEKLLSMQGVYPHLYGKTHTKPWRKMGHVTILADTLEEAHHKALEVKAAVSVETR